MNNNIAIYNDQKLDTWSDIIVSFEYERFAINQHPTGGFALVFFDSIVDLPRGGGPGYSLGYTPNVSKEYCKMGGFPGLQAAFLGIGFDNKGYFASTQDSVAGLPLPSLSAGQSITVRGGVAEEYDILKIVNLNKVLSSYSNATTFTVDQSASSTSPIARRSVRVMLKNNATRLLVQLKDDIEREEFDTVIDMPLAEKRRTSLKVALTNTSENEITNFKVINFNTAGFPGVTTTQKLDGCSYVVAQPSYTPQGNELCSGSEHITTVLPNQVVTYTTDTVKYNLKNIIYTGTGIRITGCSEDYVVGLYEASPVIAIYKYLGEKLAKSSFVNTPDNQIAKWVDIDIETGTMAVLTRAVSGVIYIYNYVNESENKAEIGTWKLYQTIPYTPTIFNDGGFQDKLKIDGKNLAVNATSERVHMFRKTIFNTWSYVETLSATIAPNVITGFGDEIAIAKDHLLIGAPQSQKVPFPEPTQGEVYHYVYNENNNKWNFVMALGSFYNLNTPLGTFGSSISFKNDICVVGSPGEEFRHPDGSVSINIGRIHIFRKTPTGIFSQGTSIAPDTSYIERDAFYGSKVSLFNNYAFILSPYTPFYDKSYITVLDLNCQFKIPPPQVNIPACALVTFDRRDFVLDTVTGTYLLSYTCQLGSEAQF